MIEQSLWRSVTRPPFSAREFPKHVDVAIVGGGITGLTAAYLLKKAGKRVAVFERERIGAGETGNTSAHLTYITDARLTDLIKRFGKDAAARVWQGGATAIDLIETHVEELNIDCDFRRVPGFLHAALFGETDECASLSNEYEAANELGFAAQFHRTGPIKGKASVAYSDQAIFHPLAYVSALARAVDGDGSYVFDEAEFAEPIEDPLAAIVNGENVTCDYLVVATHVPLAGLTGMVDATLLQTKLYPYSSYVLGAKFREGPVPGLYCDTSNPYYYYRVHDAGSQRYAVFGGADHKTGQVEDTAACYAQVQRALKEVIPDAVVERRWSGQVIETSDNLPFVGPTAERQFIATGFAGNGLTFGTLAGIMAHDFVMRASNPWQEILDPDRKSLTPGGLTTFLSENVDYPVRFVLDRLRKDRTSGIENVPRGQGKVIQVDGKPVAVHRTASGTVVAVSPVCTHMGCHVRWNKAEQTWDCPCHGSRFTPEG